MEAASSVPVGGMEVAFKLASLRTWMRFNESIA